MGVKLKRVLAWLTVSGAVYLFDRLRYVMTFEASWKFLNFLENGGHAQTSKGGEYPPGVSDNFLVFRFFYTAEFLVFMLGIVLCVLFFRRGGLARAWIVALPLCYTGTILGRAVAGVRSMGAEFHQTYLMAVLAGSVVVWIIHVVERERANGTN